MRTIARRTERNAATLEETSAALNEIDQVVASSLTPPVSIVIPAFNEEKVVVQAASAAHCSNSAT